MNTPRLSSLFALSRRPLTSIRPVGHSVSSRYISTPVFAQNKLPRSYPLKTRYSRYYATMAPLKAGDSFPSGVTFSYIPWTEEKSTVQACGIPQNYNASQDWADKKVVIFSLPGAFTPTCSSTHLPDFIKKLPELKAKGVDVIGCIAYNDAFVMSAWGKANGVKEEIVFLSDYEAKFSKDHAWTLGERTGRYAMIIDHGKVTYAENEPGRDVTVSGVDAVLTKL